MAVGAQTSTVRILPQEFRQLPTLQDSRSSAQETEAGCRPPIDSAPLVN